MSKSQESGSVRRIGLTGGVGSGKSSVARLLAQHGYPVIDTDAVAHELLSDVGGPVVAQVVAAFGEQILAQNGTIDRAALAQVVFGDPERRVALEGILHPAIGRVVEACIEALPAGTNSVVLEVPLLFEAGWDRQVDCIVVVDCSTDLQVERFVARTGATRADALRRLGSQLSRARRLEGADHVVPNEGSLTDLEAEVAVLLEKLRIRGDRDGC